jgi:hypothetical protein
VSAILKESGVRGLYQGLAATILKQSSNQGLRFMFFNKYKDIITEDGKVPMTPLKSLVGGMMAGCFSTMGNNPFDVVKTQMQGRNTLAPWIALRRSSLTRAPRDSTRGSSQEWAESSRDRWFHINEIIHNI